MKDKEFKIQFDSNWFVKGDILEDSKGCQCKVLETPHKKWYKIVLQWITFGLYKAPLQYKVKVL